MNPLEKPIVTWFKKHKRDLPWRDTTPWGVLVSEFMLQQTPVNRVLPKWNEWMQRWPTPAELAKASPAEVITAWGRLGYPRRALRLHATAQIISEDFNNQVPDDPETLQLFPGIGEYTAAAIAAFAFEKRTLVMDVNIRRVLVRVIDGEEHPKPAPTSRERNSRFKLLPEKTLICGPLQPWNLEQLSALLKIQSVRNVQLLINVTGIKMGIRNQILLENLRIGMAPTANVAELLFRHCEKMNH
jgi:A/G-specific adenine glycosylase